MKTDVRSPRVIRTIARNAAHALKEKGIAIPANVRPIWCARKTLAPPMAGLPLSMSVNNHYQVMSAKRCGHFLLTPDLVFP